ncbi:MAG: hypothetical protein IT323_16715, partial [Anaerolineae bacterium]|nr:hypothetical protein [Anaerolineae bacterium]
MHAPAHAQEPARTPSGGPALTERVDYWDAGLRLAYPSGWDTPQFTAGQVLLATPGAVGPDSALHGPVLALRIVDPVRDLNLPKDASFTQIAASVTVAPGKTVAVTASGETTVAGLDAGYADILDGETGLAGQTVAFMLPDGRYGALLAVAPLGDWAEFAPSFSAILESAALLRPGQYQAPEPGDEATFAPGSVRLTLPSGWMAESMSSSAQVFRDGDPDHGPYADGSGFANGPQLVILAQPRPEAATLAEALAAVVGESQGDETGES